MQDMDRISTATRSELIELAADNTGSMQYNREDFRTSRGVSCISAVD